MRRHLRLSGAGSVRALVLFSACSDRAPGLSAPEPEHPRPTPVALAALSCTATRSPASLECRPAQPDAGDARAVIIGGQHTFVRLQNTPPAWDAGTRVLSTQMTVANLIGQPLGTRAFVYTMPARSVTTLVLRP